MIIIYCIIVIVILIAFLIFILLERKAYKNIKKEKEKILSDFEDLQLRKNKLIEAINLSKQLNEELENQNSTLENRVKSTTIALEQLNITYDKQKNQIDYLIKQSKETASSALEAWCEKLDNDYQAKEKEYNHYLLALNTSYEQQQTKLMQSYEQTSTELTEQIKKLQDELKSIENTKLAILEAQKKEQQIKEKLSFYCVTLSEAEAADIRVLERIKPELKAPRILSMLIWSTYYQKPMTTLCNNVLGTNTICGIYKITNQKNDCCYIGQAVDVAKRWKEHAKCGLGIDTPASNKLYKAMQEDGLCNFSFELLEKCLKEDLDEKERYYINLYKSKEYGYNTLAGNGKNR